MMHSFHLKDVPFLRLHLQTCLAEFVTFEIAILLSSPSVRGVNEDCYVGTSSRALNGNEKAH